MIRLEVQNKTQASVLAVGLAHAINSQAQHLTECNDVDVKDQTETFVWLRDSYRKLEKEYGGHPSSAE
jgi:hypothetical protein|tara:strand:- start:230 stop:433 length:204 start_codon:yes stop_codon:yes gene_type:complete